jgi:hypothetical protein
MTAIAFAFELSAPGRLEEIIIRALAVAGAAALGGLLAGLVAQVLARLVAARSVPRVPLNVIRLLGAVALGWVAALFLFGSGGGGWGFGGGGGGEGQGTGKGTQPVGTTARASPTEKGEGPRDTGKAAAEARLRVEVIGVPGERVYRVEGEKELHTLAEMRAVLQQRQAGPPPLQELVVVVYRNSPDPSKRQVTDLLALARELRLTPVVELPERDAP